jgi:acetolactate synthase-1/2/3 large subunit
MAQMTGGEALYRALLPEAVPFVFGVCGGKLSPFMKAVAGGNAIRYVGVRHEAHAGLMAAAIHAGTNKIAVAMAEAGPGAVNLAAGVAHAFNNNLAMLAITSNNQQMASYPGRGMFMEMDNRALFQPIVKWSAVVHESRRIPELVRTAFRQALSGRPGPVHLDVPQDVLGDLVDFDEAAFDITPDRYRPTGRMQADPALVAEAAKLLAGAQRPLIIAGGGAARSEAAEALRKLAASLGADDMPGFAGQGGVIGGEAVVRACREADVVLAAGCRFSSWMGDDKGALVRPPQKLIQIDIDPASLGRVAELAIGLQGDGQAVTGQLADALKGHRATKEALAWRDQIKQIRAGYRAKLTSMMAGSDLPMHPAALAHEIGRCMPADSLVVHDGGHTSFWSNELTPTSQPGTRFHDPGLSLLGYGLPYAIALKLENPTTPVVSITGDGSFGFTLAELDTARRYGAPVITVIHNNESWGVIALAQKKGEFSLGTELSGTDYAAIARGFGCHGETVTELSDVAPAFKRALESGLPAVLDCRVKFVPHPAMPDFSKMGRYGM